MKKDELIHMWKEGSEQMFSEKQTDKDMITQYLQEKTLKGNRSIHFNLIFYGALQLANMVLISLNLAGYQNNSSLIWILLSLLAITIGILIFNIDVFYKFKKINNYSDSLHSLIQQQLWFYRRPYEVFLILASLSAIILAVNLNLFIDNDNGTYIINNKLMVVGVMLAAFLIIYLSQKATSLLGLRRLKSYLSDLQQGVLDQSQLIERNKKRYLWLWLAVFAVLTATLILGLLKAIA
jgi:hypothetical protein